MGAAAAAEAALVPEVVGSDVESAGVEEAPVGTHQLPFIALCNPICTSFISSDCAINTWDSIRRNPSNFKILMMFIHLQKIFRTFYAPHAQKGLILWV